MIEEANFRRVLVALDGSDNAELVLRAAVTIARRANSALTLLTVVPDVYASAMKWPASPIASEEMQTDADREGEAILKRAVAEIEFPVTTVLRRGRPGPEIVAQAEAGSYDAILLGARGVGRVGALFGSVSSYVMHQAEVAVLIAHAPKGDRRREPDRGPEAEPGG